MRFHRIRFLLPLMTLFALAALAPLTFAQDNSITLTITAPEWMQDAFSDKVLGDFEAQNPGIHVAFVLAGDNMYYSSPAFSPGNYLDSVENYANKADLLYVDNNSLSVEATRAGYYLDLAPLISADTSFDESDFFPNIWQSFQWDNGIWGLPISASVNVLVYKPAAFDDAGLTYPDETWTIDDFARAVAALSKTNSKGEITTPGFIDWGANGLLLRALLGHGVYDDSVFPNEPMLDNPDLETLLTAWAEIQQKGYTGANFSGNSQDVPMRIEGMWSLSNFNTDAADKTAASLLPGGVAGLTVQGFALSRGTQHPDEAYQLMKFLTSNIEVVNRFYGDSPARQSLVGAQSENGVQLANQLSPENQALRERALENALPTSELRFMDYVTTALGKMNPANDNLDAAAALQDAQDTATKNLQAAADRHDTANVFVAGPTPTPMLNEGEVSINFNLTSNISPLPNRNLWEQEIQNFVANDPQIGQIVLNTSMGSLDPSQTPDCYYIPYNSVSSMDLSTVLNLDPFMSADAAFDENDLIGGALAQVRRDDKTWAYPLTVQPEVLWYDTAKFDEAGVPYPTDGWTVDQFNDALKALHADPDDTPPFMPDYGNTYVLLLAAAYGGLPLDYRTDPPTVHFNDPATVDALRQVLDLAKAGYLDYTKLEGFGGGGGGGNQQPIYAEALSALSWRLQVGQNSGSGGYQDTYQITTFPTGTQYTGVAYTLGTAYISAKSLNADACYRWLSELANHPELFSALPVRRSAIDSFAEKTAQGDTLKAIYNQLDAQLQDPNTIALPTQFGASSASIGSYILPIWLNRAMDDYVFNDADLEAGLDDAQMMATAYAGCVANIPNLSLSEISAMSQDEASQYFKQFTDCAVQIDPSLASLFNPSGS